MLSGSFIGRGVIYAERTFHDFTAGRKEKPDLLFPDVCQFDDSTENEVMNGDDVNQNEQKNNQTIGASTYEENFLQDLRNQQDK